MLNNDRVVSSIADRAREMLEQRLDHEISRLLDGKMIEIELTRAIRERITQAVAEMRLQTDIPNELKAPAGG